MVLSAVTGTSLEIVNTRTRPFLAHCKPDGAFKQRNADDLNDFNCTRVFEGKTPKVKPLATFSDSDKGEICQFLEMILECQPSRKEATEFLTNFHYIPYSIKSSHITFVCFYISFNNILC